MNSTRFLSFDSNFRTKSTAMEEGSNSSEIDFSGLKDEKSIEKARLRLELQHRRKVKQLRRRLETRNRKRRGVEHVVTVSTADAETAKAEAAKAEAAKAEAAKAEMVAAAASDSRIMRRTSDLSKLIDSTALEAPSPKKNEIGLTAQEMSRMNLQDRLRDRQIQMLKQKQAKRRKDTTRHSSEEVVRRSTFGAAGARQMGSRAKSYEPSTNYSDTHKIFTIHDFDSLEEDDFDAFVSALPAMIASIRFVCPLTIYFMSNSQLDAATSQKELHAFDSLYGNVGSSGASGTITEKPKDAIDAARIDVARRPKPKPRIQRNSSFTADLDDLLRDVL